MDMLAVLLLIVVLLVGGFLSSPWGKGYLGEKSVQVYTSLYLDDRVYRRLDDITLEVDGVTTQIDHVFVSGYGIFVVETKNMTGWIFGGESQAQWTQRIFRRSSQFQNPLRQNYRHVRALESLLKVPSSVMRSVVVFVGDAKFRTPMPANVTDKRGLVVYIKSFTFPVLTAEQVDGIVLRIQEARLPVTRETARRHVKGLRERTARQFDVGQACPRCGATLVSRTAKSGSGEGRRFIGCSGYPRCRFTAAAK